MGGQHTGHRSVSSASGLGSAIDNEASQDELVATFPLRGGASTDWSKKSFSFTAQATTHQSCNCGMTNAADCAGVSFPPCFRSSLAFTQIPYFSSRTSPAPCSLPPAPCCPLSVPVPASLAQETVARETVWAASTPAIEIEPTRVNGWARTPSASAGLAAVLSSSVSPQPQAARFGSEPCLS